MNSQKIFFIGLGFVFLNLVAQARSPESCGNDPKNRILDAMNCSADPCTDFYEYACGAWLKKNPLPADRSRFGSFGKLQDENELILKEALEKASVNNKNRTKNDQQIGDFYASCMDEAALKNLGYSPIASLLAEIDAIQSKSQLGETVRKLHGLWVPVFFRFYPMQDYKNSTMVIGTLDQGGMGLPSRDYYFLKDQKSKELRGKYVTHISNMLQLAGTSVHQAKSMASAVINVETRLAKKALLPVERRDPAKLYNVKSIKEVQKLSPFMDWNAYFEGSGAEKIQSVNVSVVEFLKDVDKVIKKFPIKDLKAYLRWSILNASATKLSQSFEEESFDFYGRTLSGQKEMRPRWQRCTAQIDKQMGEALGKAFVEKKFGPKHKERMLKMIENLEKAMEKNIESLDWMSADTKKAAKLKLASIANKIGYPDTWRDYSSIEINRADFYGNHLRTSEFERRRQMAKIGKPFDKTEWFMSPPTVNAYYSPLNNDINFPAGILQPPFFDMTLDDAVNYGAIGMVIGHEITHGFDDQGRKFDHQGNLRDWWKPEDSKGFQERAECFVDQYGGYVVAKDDSGIEVKQDGRLTLGENVADNGGIKIAWNALMEHTDAKNLKTIDGLTQAQRFFLGYAQVWCSNESAQHSIRQVKIAPHSKPEFRVNGTLRNSPDFQKAFGCKDEDAMVRKNRCRIW